MATTFIANIQNAAKEYALFSDGVYVSKMHFSQVDGRYSLTVWAADGTQSNKELDQKGFENAANQAAAEFSSSIKKRRLAEVDQVVVRTAVPGEYFQQHRPITPDFLAELKKITVSAPLQAEPLLREITLVSKIFPQAQLHAASDTAFYASLPPVARESSLPAELTKTLELYRFGMNGLATSASAARAQQVIGSEVEKSIVCHIGETISVSAIKKGKAVDTSVGFSPASGFPVGSQAGDIDVVTLLKIMRHKNFRPAEAELYLENRGGLLALTGTTDIPVLFKQISQNDQQASRALGLLVYKIQQAIAAATVSLEGVDVLIFTGMTAVRSPELRAEILRKLKYLQIMIHEERNNMVIGKEGVISQRKSPVKAVVIKSDVTNEMNATI